jgi:5-methylcytosine-specific restriction protein A
MNKISKARKTRIDKRKQWQAKSEEIRKRDNYTCQFCQKKSPQVILNCHHIIPKQFKELYLDNDNLISLCQFCHKYSNYGPHKNGVSFTLWLINNFEKRFTQLINKYDEIVIKRASHL